MKNPTNFTDTQFQDLDFLLQQMDHYDQIWALNQKYPNQSPIPFPFTSQVRDIIEQQYDDLTGFTRE